MLLGKNQQFFLFAVFLLFSVSAEGQTGKIYKYRFDGNLQKSDVLSENQSLIINYSLSELTIESLTNEHGDFFRANIAGHVPTSAPGKPELPVLSRLISIPEGCDFKINISEIKSSIIKPSGRKINGILYPAQEGETKKNQKKKPEFILDKSVYSSKGIISSDTVTIELLGIARNTRLANLCIYPTRYNPHSNLLEVITSMKIEITFTNSGNLVSNNFAKGSSLFNESLGKSVLNYKSSDVIPGFSDQPVKMVIITDTAYKKLLTPFIKWKTQKGYNLNVLYKGATLAGDTYTQLKDTLTRIYQASSESDPPPEYLLIIGDVKKVPYYGSGQVTDMYYGEFDGNGDYIPEMYVGRLPVADTTELKTVLNKIIQYEKFEYADTNTFYSRAFATSGNDGSYADYMNGQVKYAAENYLNSSNNLSGSFFYYPQSASAEDTIKKLINKGTTFINYTGHGEVSGWQDPTINMDSLRNVNMYPFIISNACQTAHFSNSSALSNKMVVSGNKGAIGYIGCSNDSYWDEDFYWAVGTGTPSSDPTYENTGLGAYDRLFHTHRESFSDWYITMGQVIYAGNLSVSASTSSRKKYYWETYNLTGDPSVIPIIGKPDTFDISLPDTLPNGIKSLSINADPFAYVAVSHFDTLWDASFVSSSGSVMLDLPGLSDDSCLIVITGQNKLPLIKTIYFSDVQNEYINLSSTGINDAIGNNNNSADYNESFYLKIGINNLGLTDATDLYAKISSTSDWVTINTDSVFIGTLKAGEEIVLPDALGITLSGNVPDKDIVTIQLILKDQTIEKRYTVDIVIHAPELDVANCFIDDSSLGDGDYIADPGETLNLIFRVSNQGSSNISGQFYVTSSNSDITILQPSQKSGLLQFGKTTEIPVMVKLSETVLPGSYLPIQSTLDCDPYILNDEFTFRSGMVRESFEALSFTVYPWINTSAKPWIITSANSYDGSISARSGAVSHNASSSLIMRTVYESKDSVKFYYKVSSEIGYDYLSFRLNGDEIFTSSGEVPWTNKAVAVSAGLNEMEWIYKKDQSVSSGSDCAWIDMIDFLKTSSVTYIKKDLKVAKITSPFQEEDISKEFVTVKVLNIGPDTIKGFNLGYTVNDDSPYGQYFPDTIIPFGDSVTVTFDAKADFSVFGDYEVKVFGSGNDDDYLPNDTLKIIVQNTDVNDTVGIEDRWARSIDQMVAYPNPFTEELRLKIDCEKDGMVNCSIINSSGMIIRNYLFELYPGENIFKIDGSGLIPSVYYLRIELNGFSKAIPIIKTNH